MLGKRKQKEGGGEVTKKRWQLEIVQDDEGDGQDEEICEANVIDQEEDEDEKEYQKRRKME